MSSTALAVISAQPMGLALQHESAEKVQGYLDNASSRNSMRGYRSSWHSFEAWCAAADLQALPASETTICMYLSAKAGRLRPASLSHHLAAIAKTHKRAKLPSPTKDSELILETMKGIRATHGNAVNQKAAACTDDIRYMLRFAPENNIGLRDRALLLIGFAGAFRRSELVAFNVEDLTFSAQGVTLLIRRSKTDQAGEGRLVGINYLPNSSLCPVKALEAWLASSGITAGPIFRPFWNGGRVRDNRLSDSAVAKIVKRYARRAALNVPTFSGHSLRAGFVTTCAQNNVSIERIMTQTGHKSTMMVLKYVRRATILGSDNPTLSLGL